MISEPSRVGSVAALALCAISLSGRSSLAVRAHGTLTEYAVPSTRYDHPRRVWVYLPDAYPAACADGCALLVAFDGEDYRGEMALPRALDSLIAAKRIASTIAVLIDNGSGRERIDDLGNRQRFAAFLADELVPWVRARWRVTTDPARVTSTGSSAGGLAAAYAAFQRPDVFGNVLSQSGAFWRGNEGSDDPPYEWLTSQYASASRKPIRFVLDVGSMESRGALRGAAPSILEANRRLRDVLRAKGYALVYTEVPNGVHAPQTWRPRFPVDLVALTSDRF